jgi:hypothetical protein
LSTTIDFWCVTSNAGLLSRTSTPAAASVFRDSSFSVSPLRRAGLSITLTLTPRCFAAITASSSAVSVNRNIRTLSARFAPLMASRMGFAVSSGRTISLCDMGPP